MKKFALLGFGGLGKMHFSNLLEIEKNRGDLCLKAIVGADKNNLGKATQINIGAADLSSVDFSRFNFYDTVDELLENEELDFVVSVLPTVMHAETAVKCMEKGLDVFSEKPMALSMEDCDKMIECSKRTGKLLMIGQCMRFDGMYRKLKEFVDNNTYGKVIRGEFMRYSQLPVWTYKNWILDVAQSGGCPLDFHCHDIDIINHIFGMPDAVYSFGTDDKVELESVVSRLYYPDKIITAKADWSLPQKFPFRAQTMIIFEKAVVEITNGEKMTVYTDEEVIYPENSEGDMFRNELSHFVECAVNGKKSSISTPESVRNSVYIVSKEIESMKTDKKTAVN